MAMTMDLTTLVGVRPIAGRLALARPSAPTLATLALAIAATLWGTSFVATKAVLADVPPITLAFLRFAIAAAVLVPFACRGGRRPVFGPRPALLGLIGIALFFLCQNAGLRHASAADASLILGGGLPALTALLGAIFLAERPSRRHLVGLGCSLAGVVAVAFASDGADPGASLRANGWLLLAAGLGAACTVLGRRAFAGADIVPILAGSVVYGVLLLMPASAVELGTGGTVAWPGVDTLLWLLHLGLGCSALAFALSAYGLRHLTVAQHAVVGNLELPIGLAATALLLGEAVGLAQLVGGAVVVAGAWLAANACAPGDDQPVHSETEHRERLPWHRSGTGTHAMGTTFARRLPFPIASALTGARPSPGVLAALALVGANVIWGGSAVASKAALGHMPPLTLACLRVAIALAVLLPLVARTGERPVRGGAPALLGLTGVALFCLCQNLGLRHAGAANTALINGCIPVLTALLACAVLGERLGGRRLVGLLTSLGGVGAIVLLEKGAALGASALASVLPLASAASFAAYAVLGRRAFGGGTALAVVAGSTRYGLLFLLPAAGLELATVGLGPLTVADGLLLLYLGAGCSALAFLLCGYGLAHLEAGQAAVFGNVKPLVGVALAVVLMGETVTAGQLGGGALVLAGLWLATARRPVLVTATPRRVMPRLAALCAHCGTRRWRTA